MKVQIAVIGGGLAIAAAVFYVEMKSSGNNQGSPAPISSSQSVAPSQSPSQSSVPPTKSERTKKSQPKNLIQNPNSRPQIPGGREGGEGGEGGEDD